MAGGRFSAKDALPYIISQVVGGLVAGAALYLIASGKAGFDVTAGFASNGYGEHSPEGYSLGAVFIAEVLLTAFFLLIIMGSTHKNAAAGFAPIAIGLGLTLIRLRLSELLQYQVLLLQSFRERLFPAPLSHRYLQKDG